MVQEMRHAWAHRLFWRARLKLTQANCLGHVLDKYQINELPLLSGWIGIAPMPGRTMRYEADLNTILRWGAGMVLTMTEAEELTFGDASAFGRDLADAGVIWRQPDFFLRLAKLALGLRERARVVLALALDLFAAVLQVSQLAEAALKPVG